MSRGTIWYGRKTENGPESYQVPGTEQVRAETLATRQQSTVCPQLPAPSAPQVPSSLFTCFHLQDALDGYAVSMTLPFSLLTQVKPSKAIPPRWLVSFNANLKSFSQIYMYLKPGKKRKETNLRREWSANTNQKSIRAYFANTVGN